MSCVIVIPIYKISPSVEEKASLKQALTVLSNYTFYFVCANNLDISAYEAITDGFANRKILVKRFSPQFFESIEGYNRLMLSIKFYRHFKSFNFMLIYQLDSWVFKNELAHWCDQNYDYIGAPWYEEQEDGIRCMGIGNGGFSLRKISAHIRVLKSFSFVVKPGYFYYLLKNNFSLSNIKTTFKAMFTSNNTFYLLNDFNENEDRFWGLISVRNFKWFKTPPETEALKFAVERYPSHFIRVATDIPFGCHAWEKYEKEFWEKYIKITA